MSRSLSLAALAAIVALGLPPASVSAQQAAAPDPKLVASGRKLYTTYKCDQCHSIAGRGSRKGPLDGVGAKMSAADIKRWFTHPAEMEAKLENPPKGTDSMANALKTKNIEPAEIDALVAYMQTLTRPAR